MMRVCTLVLLLGCVAGTPPGWPAGREWSLPLIDPGDDGVLAVKGTIDGHGPYAFSLDTGAPFSALVRPVAEELHLATRTSSYFYDRTERRAYTAKLPEDQIQELRVGDLVTRHPHFIVTAPFLDEYRGIRVGGTLGFDLICRSYLTLEIDRDAGRVRVALPGVVPIPSDAAVSPITIDDGSAYVPSALNGQDTKLIIDTGSAQSMLIARAGRELNLARDEAYAVSLRSFAGPWEVRGAWRPATIRIAGASVDGVRLIEMPDRSFGGNRSWRYGAGFVGQDALARFHVILDLHQRRIALAPRKSTGRGEPTRLLLYGAR